VCLSGSCTPLTCAQQGIQCGSAPDGCGGTLQCGSCTAPEICGGGGVPGVCAPPGGACALGSFGQGAGEGSVIPTCENTNPCSGYPGGYVVSCTDLGYGYDATCCPAPCALDADCEAPAICSSGACLMPPMGCHPTSCQVLGACGLVADGCGGTLDCGSCPGAPNPNP
jgi:hypothetical protein